MRRCNIVFGIFLILSIIDFALAAPVLVQEKRQASVDALQIPKDVTTILGKRVGEELEKLVTESFDTMEKPVELSDAHVSSSSAPPGPDHLMDDMKVTAPNPASPPAHPDPLIMEPTSLSPISYSVPVEQEDALYGSDYEWLYDSDGDPLVPIASPTPTEFGSDHELDGEHVPQPNPNSNPRPESGQADEHHWQVEYDQQPNLVGPSTDPDFYWSYLTNLEDQPQPKRLKLASSKESGKVYENQPNSGLSADPDDPQLEDDPPVVDFRSPVTDHRPSSPASPIVPRTSTGGGSIQV